MESTLQNCDLGTIRPASLLGTNLLFKRGVTARGDRGATASTAAAGIVFTWRACGGAGIENRFSRRAL